MKTLANAKMPSLKDKLLSGAAKPVKKPVKKSGLVKKIIKKLKK